jgi:hypothetical protein
METLFGPAPELSRVARLVRWCACVFIVIVAVVVVASSSVPLTEPVRCEDVLSLHLGQKPNEVRTILRAAGYEMGDRKEPGRLLDDTRFDQAIEWDYPTPEGWFTTIDSFSANFMNDRLVEALAIQTKFGHVGRDSDLVFRLRAKPGDGREEIEIGPTFESVFVCRRSFSRTKLPATVKQVQYTFN